MKVGVAAGPSRDRCKLNCGVGFVDSLASFGDATAIISDGQPISYRELDTRVSTMADRIGATRRLIVVAMSNELDPLVAYLGALRARCPVIVVDGADPTQLHSVLQRYDPDVSIASSPRGLQFIEIREVSAHHLHPQLALMLSTSGSTSSPKLVRLSADNLSSNAASIVEYLELAPSDRAITTLPPNYCYGLSVIHSHLHIGASIVLSNDSVLDDSFWHDVRTHEVSSFAGVPHTFDLLDRVGFADMHLPTLRTITQAGGRMPPDRVLRFADLADRDGWRLFVMYGQTEATARMAYLPPGLLRESPMAIGIPIPDGSLRVDPVDGVPGASGELVYQGPNVMMGYATSPADLALGRTVDELRTGDLARCLPNGMFEIVGRVSRFVKLFGRRVDLDQVERDLDHVGIEALCGGDDEQLVVAVRCPEQAEAARLFVVDRIGLTTSVVSIVVVDEFPRLTNGKLDYETISRSKAPQGINPDPPRRRRRLRRTTPLSVRDGFAIVFDRTDLSDDDTFIELGGDSMSYIEASVYVEQALGRLPDNWHTTSIANLEQQRRSGSAWHSVETNVVLRAVAIVLVAGSHLSVFLLEGSAHVLLAVAGYNFFRFQLGVVARTDRATGILASVARIAIPTLLWSALLFVIDETFYPISFLLVTNYVPQPDVGFRTDFWFIEALIQVMLLAFVAFCIPAVRAFHRRSPLVAAWAALAIGLFARYGLGGLWDPTYGGLPKATHIVLWVFTLGWAVAAASGNVRHRAALTAVAVLALPGFFDYTGRALVMLTGLLLLIWVPRLVLPWPLHRLVAVIANATMYIYLTHVTIPEALSITSPVAELLVALVAGVIISIIAERVMRWAEVSLRVSLRRRREAGTVPTINR
jgi:acyl-CoA synthetase (AMP-forming)/AMP-acid ligase II